MINFNTKEKFKSGVNKLYEAVSSTLGPNGSTVIIDGVTNPQVTKDGVTVARNVQLTDPLESLACEMVKQASINTNTEVGDGTTTSIVLAKKMYEEGLKFKSGNFVKFNESMDLVLDTVEDYLKTISIPVDTSLIYKIATTSANNDAAIGNLITSAFKAVGDYGTVKIQPTQNSTTSIEIVEGLEFKTGVINRYFIPPNSLMESYENPIILITDHVLKSAHDIAEIVEYSVNNRKPLAVICSGAEDSAVEELIKLRLQGILNIVLIKAPGFGEEKVNILNDISALTGAKFISGIDELNSTTIQDLGTCKTLNTNMDKTVIIGENKSEKFKNYIGNLKTLPETEELKERISKLTNGIAIVKVGAKSEAELNEKIHRIEDAIKAVEAALEGGVVVGGGCALFRAYHNVIIDLKRNDAGAFTVLNALEAPIVQILKNSGYSDEVIKSTLEQVRVTKDKIGFDALNGEIVNMFDKGIIDPVNVVISALRNAASVVSVLLSTNCAITND